MDNTSLEEAYSRLKLLEKFADIDEIERYPASKISHIQRYYKECDKYYKKLYHPAGFMHLGVSQDDLVRRPDDEYRQLYYIQTEIEKNNATTILELGCGQGINSTYLAKQNPDRQFIGLDLSLRKKPSDVDNFTQRQGDYHEMPGIKDQSIDLMFTIEALCYSTQKDKFLRTCRKKLKPNGRLIIVDPYAGAAQFEEPLSEKILSVIAKSTMVKRFDPVDEIKETFQDGRFIIEKEIDWTTNVIPAAKILEAKSLRLLRSKTLKTLARHVLPKMVRNNIVAALFMAFVCEHRIANYYYHQLVMS